MGQMEIWHGLEREVRAERSSVAFEQARGRHEALRGYPDLRAAAAAAAGCRCEQRDRILVALVAEYRATRRSVWSAAAILAMGPLLLRLVRDLKNAPGERNDAKSIVLAAFLEAVNTVLPADRIALRLFSETRRRALRPVRASLEDFARRAARDVDAIAPHETLCVEDGLDRAHFALRARSVAPEPGEKLAAYVERLMPSLSHDARCRRRELLSNQRTASLADMREAFRSITAT
jgi:hypothetical protein